MKLSIIDPCESNDLSERMFRRLARLIKSVKNKGRIWTTALDDNEISSRNGYWLVLSKPTMGIRSSRQIAITPMPSKTLAQHNRSMSRSSEPVEQKRARLLYQSRKRGILENDLLLGAFATYHLPKMSENELDEYDSLIHQENEWELLGWIIGSREPPTHVASSMVFKTLQQFVRDHHQQSDSTIIAKQSSFHIFSRQPDLHSSPDRRSRHEKPGDRQKDKDDEGR
jgi:succinate dehydrogenase assembly factor 2